MILLLIPSLLLLHLTTCNDSVTIECQNETDFYHLMYQTCRQSILCRELYYLSGPVEPTNEYNFRRFKYQLSQIRLFNDNNYAGNVSNLFIYHVIPIEWLPTIQIYYNETSSLSCHENFNFTSAANREFILISLDLMKTYKQYISNEHYCTDYNERPVLDLVSGEFHCYCMEGKECNKEGSFRSMIFLLSLMTMGLFVLLIVSVVLVATRLYKNE